MMLGLALTSLCVLGQYGGPGFPPGYYNAGPYGSPMLYAPGAGCAACGPGCDCQGYGQGAGPMQYSAYGDLVPMPPGDVLNYAPTLAQPGHHGHGGPCNGRCGQLRHGGRPAAAEFPGVPTFSSENERYGVPPSSYGQLPGSPYGQTPEAAPLRVPAMPIPATSSYPTGASYSLYSGDQSMWQPVQ